jgi:predicted O-methyltransferase YrrM
VVVAQTGHEGGRGKRSRPSAPARIGFLLRTAPRRAKVLRTYGAWRRSPRYAAMYLLADPELDNFTYELGNIGELAEFLADALGADREAMAAYIRELEGDHVLRRRIERRLSTRVDRRRTMPYGRRLGWYAIVRHRKPALLVETGIHDGLGSSVLLRALARNADEGVDGRLVSFDTRRSAGWLIPKQLRRRHDVVIGDSLALLGPTLRDRTVDFFIHDSDHRYEYETAELETVFTRARPGTILLSDNAHAGSAMADFCGAHELDFRYWHEVPARHFYPGAGIGLAVVAAASGRDHVADPAVG